MDSFFDFIFSNFFIVIIVVVGLINLFSRSKKANQETNRQEPNTQRRSTTSSQSEQPTSLSDAIEQRVEQARETFQQTKDTFTETVEELPQSVEEQRKEQYEKLRRQMQPRQHRTSQGRESEHRVNLDAPKIESPTSDSNEHKVATEDLAVATHLDKKLTRQGLAESIVMAEVLGPPRALNPYRNVASRRKRN